METINPKLREQMDKIKKLIRGAGGLLAVIVLAVIFGGGAVYEISEQEQAVITTFGAARAVTAPGLHFKIPLVQRVRKVNTTIQGMALGYDQSNNESKTEDSLMITKDYNFVNVDFFIEYKVADAVKVLYASREPELILENISKSCIRTVIGSHDVDDVLTTGKNEIQAAVKDMIISKLEEHDVGLQVVNVTIQDSEPPTEAVMEAFKAVETAKQGKETAINNANKYRNERLPGAEAEIDKIMQESASTRARRVNEANAEVARFNAMYEEYARNPEITRKRMFYETMEEVLPGMRVIIDGTGQTDTILPLDSFISMDRPAASEPEQSGEGGAN